MITITTTCQGNPKQKYEGHNLFKAIYIWVIDCLSRRYQYRNLQQSRAF